MFLIEGTSGAKSLNQEGDGGHISHLKDHKGFGCVSNNTGGLWNRRVT